MAGGAEQEEAYWVAAEELHRECVLGKGLDIRELAGEMAGAVMTGAGPPPECFAEAGKHARRTLNRAFKAFVFCPLYARHRAAVLAPEAVSINDVLQSSALRPGLAGGIGEGGARLVTFWVEVRAFEGARPPEAEECARGAAALFDRFLAEGAPEAIGLDEATRAAVQAALPAPGCFRVPLHLVYTALRLHFWPVYLSAPEYREQLERAQHAASAAAAAADPETATFAVAGQAAAHPRRTGADGGAAEAGEEPLLQRRASLSTVDEWGVFHRDAEVDNPLFAPEEKRVSDKKREKAEAAKEEALKAAQELIGGVYADMEAHRTIEPFIRRRSSTSIVFEPDA